MNRRALFLRSAAVLAVPAIFGTLAVCAETRPVAQLVNVSGDVQVRREGSAPARARLLTPLHAGDVLVTGVRGGAEVFWPEAGTRFRLPAGGTAKVGERGLVAQAGAAPVALPSRKPLPRGTEFDPYPGGTKSLTKEDQPVRGTPYGAQRDFPVTLHWTADLGEKEQVVRVRDENKQAVHEATLSAAAREMTVPESALERGRFYVWTVTAPGESKSRVIGWVRVLLPSEKAALEFLEKETEEERKTSAENPAPLLLLAQTYERFGMAEDARRTYEAASRLRPNDTGLQDALKRLGG